MSTGQQIGLIGSSVRVQSLPTASAATFGEGNRFYTLIGQQDGYITGHTYRTVMANDVYSWEDVRNELMLLALVDGTITADSSIEVALSNFNRQPLVDNSLIVYSNANQYALMKVSAVTSTAATLIVKDNSAENIVSTKGETGAAGVGITNATAGEPIVADGKTTTPITFSFSDGTTKEFNVEAQNGTDGAQGVGVKSITSGTPTVVNDKTNTPILITLTDNTTVGLVVSAENGKDGTSATVDIVQATGQSTTSVMSQKAVTDELNKKANTSDIPTKTSQLTNDSDYTTKSYVDTQDNKKLDKAGGSITGNLTIGGNLIVNGATTSIDSTTLKVSDKLIEVAKDNTAKLTTPAGIVVPKYDGTNYGALVIDSDGNAQVGDVKLDSSGNIDVTNSDLQILTTREGLTDGNLVKWDGTKKTLVPDTTVASNASSALSKANANATEISTIKTTYQTKTDNTLGTTSKTVVGAINEVKGTADGANSKASVNATEISNIKNGTTVVKNADHANTASNASNATNVTTNINGHAITDIFETNGTTAKEATHAGKATSADKATQANSASKVAKSLTFSGQNAQGTESTIGFDGSQAQKVDFNGDDFVATKGNAFEVSLAPSGVTAYTYNNVTVDEKGRVTAGSNKDYATTAQVNAKYTKPESGIPKSDLAEDVKTSLGKADTAVQNDDLSVYAKKAELATVATSGSYNDLNDKPTIPTKTSELTNDSNFATTSQVNAKYTKPSGGIPKSDLAVSVQTSLDKADTALQNAPVTSVNGQTGDVTLEAGDVGALPSSTEFVSSVNGQSGAVTGLATTSEVNAKYTKPSDGIPKSDLSSSVQTSLGKADTALQSAPVTSVNGKTGAVQLAASDVGALPTSTKYVVSVNGESGEVKNIAKTNSANTFTGNQTVTGNGYVSGNFTVGGNLTINGTTTTVDSTTLQVKDKLIEVAHGNTTTLTTPAGLVAPKYDGTNSGALVFDSTGTAYVGDVKLDSAGNIDVSKSELQPLATRTGLVGGNLVQYDSTAQTLKDSGKKISDLATTSQVNAKYTKPSGGIPKTDLASDVQTSLGKADSALQANDISGKANLAGGNTFSGKQTLTNPASDGYSIDASGYIKCSWLQAPSTGHSESGTGMVCVLSSNGWIYYRTPSEILAESGGAKASDIKNGTLKIQKNGTDVATFTANQSSSVTANITVPTKVGQLENDVGFTTNEGTITGINMNGASKGTSGVVDLGTVLTDSSKFATAAQGTKADNAMPKSGGTFTGNISVPKTITFTDTNNPFIKMTTSGTDFYFQSTSGQFGLGPTWNKATHWDSNGNVTFPTTPKVGSSSLALKTDLSGKQDKLTAGSNITISGNTISATVPTVNNGTLTIQKNGTKVATFGANQSTNATANITVPVKVSELTNDSGFTTNKGTVTQVKINGATKSPNSAGLVDLGTGFAKTADLPIKSASLSGTTLYLTL